MRRQLYTGGGIANLQRQGYGLGDIVKKAGKVVKQVFKSDVGKAALLGAGLYGLGGGTFFGKGFPGMGGGFSMGNILPNIKGLSTVGKAALGTGAALAFGGGDPTKTKGFDMAKRKGSVEEYLRRYYKEYKQSDWQTGWTQDEEDAFVAKYTTEYNQGGRVGLQAGGQPVVDPRMSRNIEENVRMNNLQKEMNERIKKGSKTGGLDLRNRYIPGESGGITGIESGARMYGINPPQNYNLYNPSLAPNEAQLFASYRNQGLKPEQIKAISYFDAMEGRGAGPNTSPIPMPHDPMFEGNIFTSDAERMAGYQEGLRRQMLEGSPEVYFDKEYKLHDSEYLRNLYNKGFEVPGHGTYRDEQEAIADLGIERYNQLMSKGGRVGLYAGGDPEDYPETGPEINIQDLIQEEGIQVGPQVKKLDAGAPSIKRTGNMETEDSQLVERYNEHKEEGGTMSFDEFEKFESMTAYYPGDVFSRAEISALFRDSSLTTNLDRKQLHKILMNPGMFPEAESMLIKLLRSGNAYGGRVGAFGGGVMGGRVGLKVLRDLFNDEEEEAAQGGRIGYDAGVGPVGSLAMNEESVPQLWLSDEAGALPKTEGGVLPGDLGNLTIDDFDNIEDYMRYLRMMNQNNQGGRIGAFGGGVMGIGTPGMGLPGIPQMAPDGLEYNMKAGGFQNLGAQEGKDDVNAKLAKNEFVMTADAVRGAGGGNIEVGAQRMYDTMKQLEGKVA